MQQVYSDANTTYVIKYKDTQNETLYFANFCWNTPCQKASIQQAYMAASGTLVNNSTENSEFLNKMVTLYNFQYKNAMNKRPSTQISFNKNR